MEMSKEIVQHLISRLMNNATEAWEEAEADKQDKFKSGRATAYYEMLDILQSELDVYEQDLKEYGLDVDLLQKMQRIA